MSSGRCNARSTPCAPTRLEPSLAPALSVGRNQPTARCPDVPGEVIPQHHGLAKATPLTGHTKPRIRPLDARRPFLQQSTEKLDTFAPILATQSEAWSCLLARCRACLGTFRRYYRQGPSKRIGLPWPVRLSLNSSRSPSPQGAFLSCSVTKGSTSGQAPAGSSLQAAISS